MAMHEREPATTQAQIHRLSDFIWGVADDVLRDIYNRGINRSICSL